jgi:GntR family transcriptional repressor for pyruvate dehydrogenase complex
MRQVDCDLAFHQAIAEASHNVIVGHLTASLLRLMRDNLRRNLSELMQVPAAKRATAGTTSLRVAAPSSRAMPDQALVGGGRATSAIVRQNLARMLRSDARLKL